MIRKAYQNEVILSATLIGAAMGLICGTIFSTHFNNAASMIIAVSGICCLLISVLFGGRGIAYGVRSGPENSFNKQAISGLVGLILLVICVFVN